MLEQAPAMFESGLIADIMKQSGMAIKFDAQPQSGDVQGRAHRCHQDQHQSDRSELSREQDACSAIFGQGIEGRVAVVNNLLVYAIAGDPEAGVRKLIDQAKGGATQPVPSEVQAAMQLIPGADKATFFATYNFLRVIQMVDGVLPLCQSRRHPCKAKAISLIAGKVTGGNLSIDLAVPKQHVMEIMSVFMQMQQQTARAATTTGAITGGAEPQAATPAA